MILIPEEFRAALNLTPNCTTLLSAISDRLREEGAELAAGVVSDLVREKEPVIYQSGRGEGWFIAATYSSYLHHYNLTPVAKEHDQPIDTYNRILIAHYRHHEANTPDTRRVESGGGTGPGGLQLEVGVD